MATVLYLRNTTTNGITDTGDTVVYDMVITAGAALDTGVVTLVASGTEIQWTKTAGGNSMAFISGRVPVGGFTLAAEPTCSIWGEESNVNDNTTWGFKLYKYVPGPTITQIEAIAEDGVEFTTSPTERTKVLGTVDPDITFAENDRILLRLFAVDIGTMTAGTATLSFNAAAAATGDSFLSIVEAVTFKAEAAAIRASVMYGSAWKAVAGIWIMISGAWKAVTKVNVMYGGAWKDV